MTRKTNVGVPGPDVPGESDDAAPAGTPVADADGVRFTVFFEIHGPRVFSIGAAVLLARFGALSRGPEDLLSAFRAHEARIVEVAARHKTRGGAITPLPAEDFAHEET